MAELTEVIEAELASFGRDAFVDNDRLRAVRRLRERAEALELTATAVWDRQQQWRTEGHLTAAAALRATGCRRWMPGARCGQPGWWTGASGWARHWWPVM